jgi:L-asparaginase
VVVRVLATGGTIASRLDDTGAVVPAVGAEELLAAVPGLDAVADIAVEEISRVNGWNVAPATMVTVAERARAALEAGADGVVVTHGTDTVEETLYLCDLLAGDATGRGAIAFACAMRSGSDVSADGPRNLLHAVTVAASPEARGRGALLCVNDEIHAARWATKTDTTNVSTFRSPPAGPVGGMEHDRPRFWLDTPRRPPHGHRVELDVALLKAYSGMDDALLRFVVDRGARGVVVEGTGAGNLPGALLPGVEHALERGVPVVVASRCWTGRPQPIYGGPGGGVTLERMGVIRSNGLNAQKARLALMVALGLHGDLEALRAWFADA